MRASRLWVLPGLACAALVLSCETDPQRPIATEDLTGPRFAKGGKPGPPGGGGGGGGGTRAVSAGLSGALVTAADHPMTATDGRKKLEMYIADQGSRGFISFEFANAFARWNLPGHGGCWTAGSATQAEFNALALRFTGYADPVEFAMTYDKTADGAPSSNHSVGIQPNSLIGLPGHGDPPPVATRGTDADQNETYTYTGGVVTIWGEGRPKDRPKIFCLNAADGSLGVGEDVVVVTVKP